MIRKAVFPVAGLGTRFLPATKASPKEMLPVVDKPLIQYAVEEAVAAGIHDLIFITGRGKRAIEDHFDRAYELESELAANQKHALLERVQDIVPKHVNCIFVRQPSALGLGHAVLCAQPVVGNEPFAVILADDLIDATVPVMEQMVKQYRYERCSILGVQSIEPHETRSYGVISSRPIRERVHQIDSIIEKPSPENAPSNLGVVGRYILTPAIFDQLNRVEPGAGGEIQLTDGIARLLKEERVLAYEFEGQRYDCGSKLGYLQATVNFGCRHPELGEQFSQFLKGYTQNQPVD
ncbi:MAG: UTP--glucose-1-phosphate uridylyltransferase GalU [Pseudomonadota bacterium]